MLNISNNNPQNNIQAKISFRKDMKTLKMNLPGIDKSLKGYGYKYQNFNEIVEEIENVIEKHNLELDFEQYPISKFVDGQKEHVIRTTFYSTSTGYEFSFDTRLHTENLQWNNENNSKNVVNTVPQLVGSAITYFKRYALVACLHIKSEVDTDAAPIYNNHENVNSMPSRQVSVNQKQEQKREQKQEINQNQKNNTIQNQKRDIKQEQKKDRLYYYGVFKEALSNIKDWVNSPTIKDNINSIIQKISFIQNIDPNNFDDIKKIESDLISYFEKNSDFKSVNYWAEIIKNYFKKNNRLKDLQDFEKFMAFKRTVYGPSPLIFFSVLKEYERFDEIFAA
ncbi:single-stranded DNA-binding protein (plasmid) [Borreliella bissettiae]|uniref:Single-stranded DNA-binding protein n=1 Tax=Borrelia bissettiae TaxID=64897 RepID=A0A1L8Z951_BORBI|nr:ERF family protein [Borreliella bissettiae]OJH14262.1 single-stranded DNA-binding protein [Borreliella bissettiae]